MSANGAPFTVRGEGQFPQQLERVTLRAQQRNLQSLLVDALRHIAENLQLRPREWGDPYMNFRGLHAVAYGRTVVTAGIRVEYTVHESEPLVWITAMWALPGSPLA